ncbi:hypothetical protein V6S02_06035 [Microbacterium sp. CCNWLW134]|uniref:hypothetical protein n=1 Tax=Microbacterium sp. CCNWLW134 TaxID=3122064 RepID=UPI0030104291
MSTKQITVPAQAPAWAWKTEYVEEDGVRIFLGLTSDHNGVTAQIVASDFSPRPIVDVRFDDRDSGDQFYMPLDRLEDLIEVLKQTRDVYKEATQ